MIRRRFRKLRKSAKQLTAHSSVEEYHFVRRQCKRLRYAIEAVAEIYGKDFTQREMVDLIRQRQIADFYMIQATVISLQKRESEVLPPDASTTTGLGTIEAGDHSIHVQATLSGGSGNLSEWRSKTTLTTFWSR